MVAQLLLLYENAGGTESAYWMDYNYKRLRLQIELKDYNSNEAEKEMNNLQAEAHLSLIHICCRVSHSYFCGSWCAHYLSPRATSQTHPL